MKKRKSLIILSVFLTLSIVVSICVVIGANADRSMSLKEQFDMDIAFTEEGDVQQSRQIEYDGKTVAVTYQKTTYLYDHPTTMYVDEENNQYGIDEKGVLKSFYLDSGDGDEKYKSLEADEVMTEQQAIEFARAYFKERFPESEKDSVVGEYYFNENENSYEVGFMRQYGEDDLAIGERFTVRFYTTGVIQYWALNGGEHMYDFKTSMLSGITKDKLEAYAKEELEVRSEGSSEGYSFDSSYIRKVDNDFALEILLKNEAGDLEFVFYDI